MAKSIKLDDGIMSLAAKCAVLQSRSVTLQVARRRRPFFEPFTLGGVVMAPADLKISWSISFVARTRSSRFFRLQLY